MSVASQPFGQHTCQQRFTSNWPILSKSWAGPTQKSVTFCNGDGRVLPMQSVTWDPKTEAFRALVKENLCGSGDVWLEQ